MMASANTTPLEAPLVAAPPPEATLIASPTTPAEVAAFGAFCATRGFAHRFGPLDRFTRRFTEDPAAALHLFLLANVLYFRVVCG